MKQYEGKKMVYEGKHKDYKGDDYNNIEIILEILKKEGAEVCKRSL